MKIANQQQNDDHRRGSEHPKLTTVSTHWEETVHSRQRCQENHEIAMGTFCMSGMKFLGFSSA